MEVDATPPFSIGSVSLGISPYVTWGGHHVAMRDTEQAELDVAKGTKKIPLK